MDGDINQRYTLRIGLRRHDRAAAWVTALGALLINISCDSDSSTSTTAGGGTSAQAGNGGAQAGSTGHAGTAGNASQAGQGGNSSPGGASPGGADGGFQPSAGQGGSDPSGGGGSGNPPSTDGGVLPANALDAPVMQVMDDAVPDDQEAPGLTLEKHTLAVLKDGTPMWLAIARSTSALCSIGLQVTFMDGEGQELDSPGLVYAPLYRNAVATPQRCLLEGDVGVAATPLLGFPDSVMPEDIVEIRYTAVATQTPDAVPAPWVTVSDLSVVATQQGWSVRGTLTSADAALAWWRVNAVPMDAAGFPLTLLQVNDPATAIPPDTSWQFVTPPLAVEFSEVHVFPLHSNPM